MLALLVLVIGVSVWLIAGEQRQTILGTQGQLRSSNDLLTAMLDQETGLRGYALTGVRDFLEPYELGLDEFDSAHDQAVKAAEGDRTATAQISALTATAREWQAHARIAVGQVERPGRRRPASATPVRARRSWTASASRTRHCAGISSGGRRRELQHSRSIVFAFVLLFGGGILALGMIIVERQARRDRERAAQRREYVEALQGADDELEARSCCAAARSAWCPPPRRSSSPATRAPTRSTPAPTPPPSTGWPTPSPTPRHARAWRSGGAACTSASPAASRCRAASCAARRPARRCAARSSAAR